MKKRSQHGRVLLKVLVALLGLVGVTYFLAPHVRALQDRGARNVATPGAPTLAAQYAEQQRKFALQPDRRCVLAAATIDQVLNRKDPVVTALKLNDKGDGWELNISGRPVGRLPMVADISDCHTLLKSLVPPSQATSAAGPPVQFAGPVELLAHLQALDDGTGSLEGRWGTLATGLVYLYAQSADVVGMDDRLPALALALDAIDEVRSGQVNSSRRALLAYLMGYRATAQRLAAGLPEHDTVARYVREDEEALSALSQKPSASPLERFLLLRSLAEGDDFTRWVAHVERLPPAELIDIPVWQAALLLRGFWQQRAAAVMTFLIATQMDAIAAGNYPHGWRASLGSSAKGVGSLLEAMARNADSMGPVIDLFEEDLERVAISARGKVINGDLIRSYFRAYFYSTLYAAAIHQLDQIASVEHAKAYRDFLGRSKGDHAGQFVAWYTALIEGEHGKDGESTIVRALEQPMGDRQRTRLYETLQERYMGYGEKANATRVQKLADLLDGRPHNARFVAWELRSQVHEFNRSEELIRFAAGNETARAAGWQIYFASLRGDAAALAGLARSVTASPDDRRAAFSALEKLGTAKDQELAALRESIFGAAPRDYATVRWQVRHLLESGRFDDARALAQAWLDLRQPDPGLQRVVMQTLVARSFYEAGRYDMAWGAVGQAMESGQGDALALGAQTLGKRGKHQEADALWKAISERYPGPVPSAHLQYLWENHRHDDAAALIKALPRPLRPDDWRDDVAPAFFKATREMEETETVAAVKALVAVGYNAFDLYFLPTHYAYKGLKDRALAIRLALPAYPGIGQVVQLTYTYRLMREVRGEAAALEWIDGQLPGRLRAPASLVFYQYGEPALLWSLIPNPALDPHGDWVWLVRAFASVRFADPSDGHASELRRYYDSADGDYAYALGRKVLGFNPDYVHTLGRYMLGLETEETVLALQVPANEQYVVAYALALRKHCSGQLREASVWYRMVMTIGPPNKAEYRWATDQLYKWFYSNRLLGVQDAGCTLAAPPAEDSAGA